MILTLSGTRRERGATFEQRFDLWSSDLVYENTLRPPRQTSTATTTVTTATTTVTTTVTTAVTTARDHPTDQCQESRKDYAEQQPLAPTPPTANSGHAGSHRSAAPSDRGERGRHRS